MVLKRVEVEIHPCPELKNSYVCATCHRIQSLTKLLWKSPVLNFIQNGQSRNMGKISLTPVSKLLLTLHSLSWNSHLFNRSTLWSSSRISVTAVQKCALFGRISLTSLREAWQSQSAFPCTVICACLVTCYRTQVPNFMKIQQTVYSLANTVHTNFTRSFLFSTACFSHTHWPPGRIQVQKEQWNLYCNW